MVRALIKGEESPEQMAQRARGRLRKRLEQLALALRGKVESHHRFMLEMQLGRVEDIEANIAIVDSKIDEAIAPHRTVIERLMTIPGVDRVVAVTVIAELGIDMNVFPTPAHAATWGGVCPGNNESASKRMGQQKRRGNVHLATILVQAAMAASKTKDTLKARFWKIAGRAGKKRAALAVAHSIPTRSTTCSRAASITRTSAATTSIDSSIAVRSNASCNDSDRWVTTCVLKPLKSKGFLECFHGSPWQKLDS
jgi:transposase